MPASLKHIPSVFFLWAALLTGCSLVDEDRTDCVTTLELDCKLLLASNMDQELQSRLGAPSQQEVRDLLHGYLDGYFACTASDIHLSFYETLDAALPLYTEKEEAFSGHEQVYRLDFPVSAYRNLSVANLPAEGGSVAFSGGGHPASASLVQAVSENRSQPHGAALYAGRKDFLVPYGTDAREEVRLFMANCASALVVDASQAGSEVEGLTVYVDGMATEFHLWDSSYVYTPDVLVETRELDTRDGSIRSFVSVHFPSPDNATKAEEEPIWRWLAYVKMKDGTINESRLNLTDPLPAGQLKVLTARLTDTGIVTTEDTSVGVSVTLDWSPGMGFELPL